MTEEPKPGSFEEMRAFVENSLRRPLSNDELLTVRQQWKQQKEAKDVWDRGMATFPVGGLPAVKAHLADLRSRFEAGDPNVVGYAKSGGSPPHSFELRWTPDQRAHLTRRYFAEKWNCDPVDDRYDLRAQDARLFVRILEGHAGGIPLVAATLPGAQKDRQRAMESVANAFDKLVDSLKRVDSAALGWLMANVEDAAAQAATTLRNGPDRPSLKLNLFRASVEGGEIRSHLEHLARAIGPALRQCARDLPPVDHTAHGPRRHAAFAVDKTLQDHGLPLETTETGFAAECLRMVLSLAGQDVGQVAYWLKEVAKTPSDERPFWAGFARR